VASFGDADVTTKVGAPPSAPRAGGLVGVTVAAKYCVRSALGSGGMANVYEAEELRTGRSVAFKVLPPYRVDNEVAARRLEREARLAGGLGHENLVAVLDAGELPDGRPYIVMERLRGETLRRHIDFVGPLPPLEAVEIALQMLAGLAAAHEGGVLHRDVKPENVFIEGLSGAKPLVKLLDFGLAAALDPSLEDAQTLTRAGMVVGTPAYMAPEQVRGERDLDTRVDIYAVGAVLYEMLSARRAFEGTDPGATMLAVLEGNPAPLRLRAPSVPRSLDAAVCRAMAPDRDARPASARELAEELARVRQELLGSVPDLVSTDEIPVYPSTSDLEATAPRPAAQESVEPVTDRVDMSRVLAELQDTLRGRR
jgi:serine/threonine-protein kinase